MSMFFFRVVTPCQQHRYLIMKVENINIVATYAIRVDLTIMTSDSLFSIFFVFPSGV
jgi:hypothetical protein